MWNVTNPQQPHLLATLDRARQSTWSLVFSPDGHTLAAATTDLTLWETDPERHRHTDLLHRGRPPPGAPDPAAPPPNPPNPAS